MKIEPVMVNSETIEDVEKRYYRLIGMHDNCGTDKKREIISRAMDKALIKIEDINKEQNIQNRKALSVHA